MDARDLLPLAEAVEAAREAYEVCLLRGGFASEEIERLRREWREARYRFREALVDAWPRLEVSKCLPDYDKVIRRSEDASR